MTAELSTLKSFSELFGHSVEYSQGGGSNASAKVDGQMIIKASGFTLAEMVVKKGYTVVKHAPIAHIYTQSQMVDEDAARTVVSQVMLPPDEWRVPATAHSGTLKPSIETGFHSYLPKYVLHIHPLYLNAILCLKDCAPILGELYSDLKYIFVKYKRPGHFLSAEIAQAISSPDVAREGQVEVQIIFLKNHGLIVSSDDPNLVIETAQSICDKAKQCVLNRTGLPPFTYDGLSVKPFPGNQFLFPDAAVFLFDAGKMSNPSRNVNEVLFVHNALLELTEKLGGPEPLSDQDVQELLEMEEEKYRQVLVKL